MVWYDTFLFVETFPDEILEEFLKLVESVSEFDEIIDVDVQFDVDSSPMFVDQRTLGWREIFNLIPPFPVRGLQVRPAILQTYAHAQTFPGIHQPRPDPVGDDQRLEFRPGFFVDKGLALRIFTVPYTLELHELMVQPSIPGEHVLHIVEEKDAAAARGTARHGIHVLNDHDFGLFFKKEEKYDQEDDKDANK